MPIVDQDQYFFGYMGIAAALVFANLGAAYGTAKSGVGICSMGVLKPDKIIKSVIDNFIFFVHPKWKIASDRPGSGNTRNIGGITEIDKLVKGDGPFAKLGEETFDHYWMNFFNASDARAAGIGTPRYNNLETYRAYLQKQQKIRKRIEKK